MRFKKIPCLAFFSTLLIISIRGEKFTRAGFQVVKPQAPTATPKEIQTLHEKVINQTSQVQFSIPERGAFGDEWANIVLGQPDFSLITSNEVVGNKLINPGGVFVDQSIQPNRVFIYDAGKNRIFGFTPCG